MLCTTEVNRRVTTVPAIRARKGGVPVVMVTAYDVVMARLADAAEVDALLVGDTLGMVLLGHENTLPVTVETIAYHVEAVTRARPRALVVGDLPWLSYHLGTDRAVEAAARLIRAGAGAVKLEGGRKRVPARAILDAEIPVMGHLGTTPQSVHALGGMRKVSAKDVEGVASLVEDATAVAEAGCFAVVLEAVPAEVAKVVTEQLTIPTIGIGAGPHCDGQVLVTHDLLGFHDRVPRFVRRYGNLGVEGTSAVALWADDVRAGRFPSDEESYHAPDELGAVVWNASTEPDEPGR